MKNNDKGEWVRETHEDVERREGAGQRRVAFPADYLGFFFSYV